ncbi:HvfC/BufC N-terminal domain-containing protein [Marinobacterium rhizophilum]|uniref:DNA-binding domain-containing protein n=1 Tax=Marinobacterium rhizophilum TaxID=420402 RepID=A0ABY5HHP0_9GAMM|nr:DNA-binding domain-containing protein [Marinobacterium rhizophilum]UTW11877.1 putative DNA-binding domain-containing protein [Marinobacterium rhizophilum]
MSALNRLQRAFAEDLWGTELRHLQGLVLDGRLPAARLLQIYRNNFSISLEEALAADYPVLKRLVGTEFFQFLADHYLRAHPSRCGDLLQFGDRMPAFIAGFKPAAGLAYLSDVARLEWACHEVVHAPDNETVDIQTLALMSSGKLAQLHFRLGPACRLVDSIFPIYHIWQCNQAEIEDPQAIHLNSGAETVLVIRPQLRVQLWSLQPGASLLLQQLAQGAPLGHAVEQVLAGDPTFDLQPLVSHYLAAGVLVPLKSKSDRPSPAGAQS